jgi:peptide/nickel transport system substrate-binding protein
VLLRTSDVAFPGAVDAAQLYQQSAAKAGIKIEIKREPGDGYWSEVWNKQPFSMSYWGGRADAGPDVFDRLFVEGRLERHALPARGLRQDAVCGARELDQAKRKGSTRHGQ